MLRLSQAVAGLLRWTDTFCGQLQPSLHHPPPAPFATGCWWGMQASSGLTMTQATPGGLQPAPQLPWQHWPPAGPAMPDTNHQRETNAGDCFSWVSSLPGAPGHSPGPPQLSQGLWSSSRPLSVSHLSHSSTHLSLIGLPSKYPECDHLPHSHAVPGCHAPLLEF